jgi:hypothetical protein
MTKLQSCCHDSWYKLATAFANPLWKNPSKEERSSYIHKRNDTEAATSTQPNQALGSLSLLSVTTPPVATSFAYENR